MRAGVLAILVAPVLVSAGLFPKSGPVKMIDSKEFKSIMKEEKTSVVAFVAPWCGHCKNLVPEYASAAKALDPLVSLYAVDCDAQENKQLCSEQGVKGFPTVKSFPRGGKGVPHDYQGERKAGPLVEWANTEVPNRIESVGKPEDIAKWLKTKPTQPHALLFNVKSKLPLLWRVLGNTYKDKVVLAVTRDKKMSDVAQGLGIDVSDGKAKVVVWGAGDSAATVYDGVLKYDSLNKHLQSVLDGTGARKDKSEL